MKIYQTNKAKLSILLIIIALATSFTSVAQTILVKGSVLAGQKGLATATISVLDTAKKELVKTGLTDSFGNWQLELKKIGIYQFEFSHVGFQPKTMIVAIGAEGKTFDPLELSQAATDLKAVTVTSKKPMIEVKAGKTVVNVDASASNAGATVLDILEKSPGISVDRDGNISLKGKQGVVVMIDKRPTYLSAQDLVNMLKSMPSNQLDQIEIITQPGSSFDAAGNSGVINLKMKKNKIRGSNGSVTTGLTQGYFLRNNQGANFNYKNKKLNIFSSVNYDYNRRKQDLDVERLFVDPTTKQRQSRFFQAADQNRKNEYIGGRLGMDYELDSTNVVGFVAEYSKASGGENWKNESDIFNSTDVFLTKSRNNQITNYNNKNLSLNVNWRKTFSKTASLFTNLDMITYDNVRAQDLNTLQYNNLGVYTGVNDIQMGDLPSDIKIYLAKVDYEKTFAKGQKLEAGLKTSFVNTKNDAGYFLKQNNVWVVDNLRTNNFEYDENINAAYVSYAFKKGKKWEFNFGLRAEQTIAKGYQKANDSSFVRNYINLFPTVFASHTINEKQSISLSLGRRVQRPDYQDMNPFRFYLDQFTYQIGNVFLQPHFTYNAELNYSMLGGKLNHTLGYSFTNNAITDIIEQNELTNETFVSKQNVAKSRNLNYSISYNAPITKWYNASLYAETNIGVLEGTLNGVAEKINTRNVMFNLNNQFTLSKTWRADFGSFFRPKGNEGLIVINQMWAANAGISKTMLKGKGTLRFSFRDIFNTQHFTAAIKYGNVDTRIRQWGDRHTMGVNFTYRFSKGIKFQQAKKKESSNDEKSRVK